MSFSGVIAILAGGQGKRLWPVSTPDRPKQFAPLFEGRSMLQLTFDRAALAVGSDGVVLVGNARHEDLYFDQLPDLKRENLILEPEGRGTAAAVLLTALACDAMFPGRPVATIPSDHIIKDSTGWVRDIHRGLDFARERRYIVCLGVSPNVTETKFGYMKTDGPLSESVLVVEGFIEKPDAETLAGLVAAGGSLRNMGTLMFMPGDLSQQVELHLPEVHNTLAGAFKTSADAVNLVYPSLPHRSIDEAVLQHSDRVAVVVSQLKSADAGDFVTLGDAMGRDSQGNAISGRNLAIGSNDNTIISEDATVAVVGVNRLVVLVDDDRILICPSDQVDRIKQLQKIEG